jgi:hypothetical protein
MNTFRIDSHTAPAQYPPGIYQSAYRRFSDAT